jgi:hypothetical protein
MNPDFAGVTDADVSMVAIPAPFEMALHDDERGCSWCFAAENRTDPALNLAMTAFGATSYAERWFV